VSVDPIQPAATRPDTAHSGWSAHLSCRFDQYRDRTRLIARAHRGPLLVQRPFYPEDNGTCHIYLVHPPGGVAGGDDLRFDATLDPGANVLITTPAATKLYRANGRPAAQSNVLIVGADATLEWLPQETLVFNGADAALTTRVEMADSARFLGWEIIGLGRTAQGETFEAGRLRQRFELYRNGSPVWLERATYGANDRVLDAAWGLSAQPVFGTFVCTTDAADTLVARIRRAAPEGIPGEFAVTALPNAVVCRYIGPWAEAARTYFCAAWGAIRPVVLGRAAQPPRIWAT
jgi:urease accessory protein